MNDEASLSLRAAWMHFVAGMTQAAVAKQLGVPSLKAHRLIARAVQDGAVKISIDGEIAECLELETALKDRYGLDICAIAPDIGETSAQRALAVIGASFLQRVIEHGDHTCIGLGHGRTLAAAVLAMPRVEARGVQFVSLLGGLTRNYSATPHDVMLRMAEKTGATVYIMPVPFFANSVEDRQVLLSQRGVSSVFRMAAESGLKLVGVGTTEADASLVSTGMIEQHEIEEVIARGGVGEILGHFFDKDGRRVETTLTARTLSVGLEEPRATRIVAIAGGKKKVGAIRSVLMSGALSGLITDERTARALVA